MTFELEPTGVRALVWSEGTERRDGLPEGVHVCVAGLLNGSGGGVEAQTAVLWDLEMGLSDTVLDRADTLFWYGRHRHAEVPDEVVARVLERVRQGMGFVALGPGCGSRPCRALAGDAEGAPAGEAGCPPIGDGPAWLQPVGEHPLTHGVAPLHLSGPLLAPALPSEPADRRVVLAMEVDGRTFEAGTAWKHWNGRVFAFAPGVDLVAAIALEPVARLLANAARWTGSSAAE